MTDHDTPTLWLTHNRIQLALWKLRVGDAPASGDHGTPLLLLHGLGERSPRSAPAWTGSWNGTVWALDFTGHGRSTIPVGGGYTAEFLLADAHLALEHLGQATVVGRGLGAYVALLLAGARSRDLRGVVLDDGPGLEGGSPDVLSHPIVKCTPATCTPDPLAIAELSRDERPPAHAAVFTALAARNSPLEHPITVVARIRPRWLTAVTQQPGVRTDDRLAHALASYAS